MKDRTKYMYAEELETMLKTTAFDDIRVTQLAKRCGASPQSFYYHFKDKYELEAWIFIQDTTEIMSRHIGTYSSDEVRELNERMTSRKTLYRKLFSDKSQNNIEAFIHKFNMEYSIQAVKKHFKVEALDEKQLLAVKYHSYGIVGLLIDWIFERTPTDIYTLSEFQYDRTPDFMKESFENFGDISVIWDKIM